MNHAIRKIKRTDTLMTGVLLKEPWPTNTIQHINEKRKKKEAKAKRDQSLWCLDIHGSDKFIIKYLQNPKIYSNINPISLLSSHTC